MGAYRLIKYLTKKSLESNIVGGKVRLDTLEVGDHFYLDVYNGLIGRIEQLGINITVKWLNHPEKGKRSEWISAGTSVNKYNHE